MSNEIISNVGSIEDYMMNSAIQKTPIADHLIISRNTPCEIDETKETERHVRYIRNGETFSERNIIESDDHHCSSPLIVEKKHKENAIEPFSQSRLKFNRKTPDLERIAGFFRNNRTPKQKGLLAQFESSVTDDTPISQRRNHYLLRPSSNKKSSDTRCVRRIVSSDDESSLIVAKNDDHHTSDLKSIVSSQRASQTTNKLGFLDQGTQSQEEPQSRTLQKIKSLEASQEIEGLQKDNRHEQKEVSSTEKNTDASIESKSNNKDVYFGGSHTNDATTSDISLQWVFKSNTNEEANSNNPTQIIAARETQQDEINGKFRRIQSNLPPVDRRRAETITPLTAQKKSMENAACRLKSAVETFHSPEDTGARGPQDLPSEPEDFDFGVFPEVARKKFPLESNEVVDITSRSTSTRCDNPSLSRSIYEKQENIEGKILLQISSGQGSMPDFNFEDDKQEDSEENASIIISEVECTQDLPELEEESTYEPRDGEYFGEIAEESFESEEVTRAIWKKNGKNRHTIQDEEEEKESKKYENHPKKRLKLRRSCTSNDFKGQIRTPITSPGIDMKMDTSRESSCRNRSSSEGGLENIRVFRGEIREEEEGFLSKVDIMFENAVWCQYNLNFRFYPGLLISYNEKEDGCWVMFETGTSLTKNDDIYYLDIRVGDTVNWCGKVYRVVALEHRTQDPNVIRCIRGYDTVHLRKRNSSGKLEKRHFIVPLSSISLDLNEWSKRPKVILEGGSHTRANAFRSLQLPIRGRRSIGHLSPKRAKIDSEITRKRPYKENSNTEPNENIASSKNGTVESLYKLESLDVERKMSDFMDKRILRDCLFIFSGLSKDINKEEYDLSDVIRSLGGMVLDARFSDLFDFEFLEKTDQPMKKYILKLDWKSRMLTERLRFGCLLSSKHLRSLKYLEALALGWPILHWKFVEQCISDGKLCADKMAQYLLPSGESFRLNPSSERSGVIKSNDVFRFHLRLLENAPLKDQLGHNSFILSDYIVLVFAHSELDQFLRFIFACLGVKTLFQIPGRIGTSVTVENIDILKKYIRVILRNKNSKMILYVNAKNGLSDEKLEEHKERLCKAINNDQTFPYFHVESKEWLIQTLVNGTSGFD